MPDSETGLALCSFGHVRFLAIDTSSSITHNDLVLRVRIGEDSDESDDLDESDHLFMSTCVLSSLVLSSDSSGAHAASTFASVSFMSVSLAFSLISWIDTCA